MSEAKRRESGRFAAGTFASLLAGAALGALWGAGFEAAALIAGFAADEPALVRVARMVRISEIAFLAGAVALLVALLARVFTGKGRGGSAAVGSATGLLVGVWLSIAFLLNPLDLEAIQFSRDPIALRTKMIALATLIVPLLVFTARRYIGALAGPRAAGILALGVGLLVAGALVPAAKSSGTRHLPDIYLITVDTLRADHLGCYGYPLPTSPAIDRLCEESIVFERAMTSVPETIPSYASLLTGLSPQEHGIFNNFQTASDDLLTLPEQLRDAGYFTAAILHHSFPGTFRNLDQGFDLVVQRGIVARTPGYTLSDAVGSVLGAAISGLNERFQRANSVTTDIAVRWLRDLSQEQPLFLHVYWNYPHYPYAPPASYAELIPAPSDTSELGSAIHRYDACVRFADAQVGRILQAIEKYRDYDGSWIAFTADHGEELGRLGPHVEEPYFGHSLFLYDSSLQVPLIIHPPTEIGLSPARSAALVDLQSLPATLLAAAGQPQPPEIARALDLTSVHSRVDASTTLFSIMRKDRDAGYDYPIDRVSARSSDWRLVETRLPSYGLELLRYRDGAETPAPLRESEETVAHFLDEIHARFPPGESPVENLSENLPPAEVELLRSLGYLP